MLWPFAKHRRFRCAAGVVIVGPKSTKWENFWQCTGDLTGRLSGLQQHATPTTRPIHLRFETSMFREAVDMFRHAVERRVWDLNPRRLSPHTLSKRAHLAALATLPRSPAERAPAWQASVSSERPFRGVTVGSCATGACEPSQGRKAAALSRTFRVPQTAWPSLPGTATSSANPAGKLGFSSADRVGPRLESIAPMAYQSLYRRYRPQKFAEIKGQEHLVAALQGAVRDDRVGHAYLFHGPRGTGKTSTARVLAKALNCTDLDETGEPCAACESCLAIEQGRSFDLHELDAASNNKVDDMRALLERVKLGTPGRTKVYLLDEVHMLTPGAENALLKTLEEPPDHVTWVLATTEPHKVVETIRSRCQVFELGLLGADTMTDHVRFVVDDAALDVDTSVVDHVVAAGGGSVRDALTALDRVVAAGGTVDLDSSTDVLLDALATGDAAAALVAVEDAIGRGRDPRTIGKQVLSGLRDAFLTRMGAAPPRLAEPERKRAEKLAERMSPAAMTRALETLGTALVGMRQAPDPRIDIEVALVRLCLAATRSAATESTTPTTAPPIAQSRPPPTPAAAPPQSPVTPDPGTPPEPAPEPAQGSSARSSTGPSGRAGPASARRALSKSRESTATTPESRTAKSAASIPAPPPLPPTAPSTAPPTAPSTAPSGSTETVDVAALRPETPTQTVELAAQHLGLGRDTVVAKAEKLLEPAERRTPEGLERLWAALVATSTAAGDASAESRSEGRSDESQPGSPPPEQFPPGESPAEESPLGESPSTGSPSGESPPRSLETQEELALAGGPPDDLHPGDMDPAGMDPAGFDLDDQDDQDDVDPNDLTDAPAGAGDVTDQIEAFFPGAKLFNESEEESS